MWTASAVMFTSSFFLMAMGNTVSDLASVAGQSADGASFVVRVRGSSPLLPP
jgi:hypothetical protein